MKKPITFPSATISDGNLDKLLEFARGNMFPRQGWKPAKGGGYDTEIRGPSALIIAMLCQEIKRLRKSGK